MKTNSDLTVQRAGLVSDQLKTKLVDQIHAIANSTYELYNELPPNILSGQSGIALFFGHLGLAFPRKQYSSKVTDLVQTVLQALSEQQLTFTLSNGVPGILYSIHHLQSLGYGPFVSEEDFARMDDYVSSSAQTFIQSGNWDPLHGYVGVGLYLLDRHRVVQGLEGELSMLVKALYAQRKSFASHKIWITPSYMDLYGPSCNFGMAHGIPGVLSFLSRVADLGVEREMCLEMVESGIGLILSYKDAANKDGIFPIKINPDDGVLDRRNKLGWCYGLTCIANSLILAGKAFDRNEWYSEGVEIAQMTADVNYGENHFADPMFCHGATGVVWQYYRYYQLTGEDRFKKALNRYIESAISQFYDPSKGIGGYQDYPYDRTTQLRHWTDKAGLLEGSAGIGLVFTSILMDTEVSWDNLFQTNVSRNQ